MSSQYGNSRSRRTSSSPYIHTKSSQSKAKPPQRSRAQEGGLGPPGGNKKNVPPRGRGSRSAPPNYQNILPDEVHEYFEMRSEMQSEIKKKMLRTKLQRLIGYQEQLAKEIDELERDFNFVMREGDESPPMSPPGGRWTPPSPPSPPSYFRAATASGSKTKLKQFRVMGGSNTNLSYKVQRKPDKDGKVRSFSVEIDVKGFRSDNIEIDTEENEMVVKASKLSGVIRDLKIVAPTVKDMEKAYIHPPICGLLVVDF